MIQDSTFLENLTNQDTAEEFVASLEEAMNAAKECRRDSRAYVKGCLLDLIEHAAEGMEYPYKDRLDDLETYLFQTGLCADALFAVQRACVIYYHNSNTLKV